VATADDTYGLGKNLPHRPDFLARELAAILDAVPVGLFTVDGHGRIELWNREMVRLTGLTPKQAVGRVCTELSTFPCDQTACPKRPEECPLLRGEAIDRVECTVRHKSGEEIPVLKNARPILDDAGNVVGAVETITDLRPIKKLERAVSRYESDEEAEWRLGRLVGKSHAMQEVYHRIRLAAASDATVLLLGETGTGKELAAEAIHERSRRRDSPLIKINCSALPETLLESELFGHEKGAFTGAVSSKPGRFELADGGTIFLDEIGDISPLIQLKLLRVLQEHEFERVGGTTPRKVDVRIIAATHRDLKKLVQEEKFRHDLYYRLRVFVITLPPLRERKEDIPLLVDTFIERFNRKTGKHIRGVTPEVALCLMDYCWPGNVRELENAIEHAFVTCQTDRIDLFDLPVEIRMTELRRLECERWQPPFPFEPPRPGPPEPVKSGGRIIDREQLLAALRATGWNKAETARRLGVDRTTVWRKMRRWGIPMAAPADAAGGANRHD